MRERCYIPPIRMALWFFCFCFLTKLERKSRQEQSVTCTWLVSVSWHSCWWRPCGHGEPQKHKQKLPSKFLSQDTPQEVETGTWLVLFKPQVYSFSRCGSHQVSIEGQTDWQDGDRQVHGDGYLILKVKKAGVECGRLRKCLDPWHPR